MQICKMEIESTKRQLEETTAIRIKRMIMPQQPPQQPHQKPPPSFKKNLALSRLKVTSILLLITLNLSLHSATTTRVVAASDEFQQHNSELVSSQQRQQVSFAEPDSQSNVQKVAVGRPIRFKCVVNNLGAHRVAWFHRDRQLLLALDNKTLAWPGRIQATTQANSVFVLQIDSVQLSDKGHYICQLNSNPVQSQTHFLDVVKPPQIREQETTINIEPVREFNPVELRCVADGIPKPTIKWRRESQTFELPVFDDGDTNELDDRHERDAPDDSDRLQRSGGTRVRSLYDGSLLKPEVAPLSSELLQTAGDGPNRTGDIANETTKIIAEQSPAIHSSAMPSGKKNEHYVSFKDQDDDVRAESKRAPLMMTAPSRRLISRAVAVRQQHQGEASAQLINSEQTLDQSATNTTTKPFIGEGEILRIERVSRYDMGYYECIASNGVPPRVSQRIFLPVSYVAPARTSIRAKENNALSQRPSGTQAGNSTTGVPATSSASQEKNTKFRGSLANVAQVERPNSTSLEPNWVASGRSYHRHRQLKATRSSSVSSGATLSKASWLTLLATMGLVLQYLLLARP